jgi:hypothetical protein
MTVGELIFKLQGFKPELKVKLNLIKFDDNWDYEIYDVSELCGIVRIFEGKESYK